MSIGRQPPLDGGSCRFESYYPDTWRVKPIGDGTALEKRRTVKRLGSSTLPTLRQIDNFKGSMKLTANIIYGFSGSVLSTRFDEPAPTPDCHKEWWEMCCSDHKFVAIAAPRQHAKSTGITKSYGLASALFRQHDHIMIVSDTYKQACMFLGEIKQELKQNLDLINLFEIKEIETDREDEIIVRMGSDGYRFRVIAIGAGSSARGFLWDGKRPNLIIGDDLENDEMVQNPDRRENFRNWINNTLVPMLPERGRMRIVGTILHMDAFLERLMPKSYELRVKQDELRIIREPSKDNPWFAAKYMAHNDDFSCILWPGKWTEKRLKEMRQLYISQGNPEGYYQEFLNQAIDPSNAIFKRDDFLDMTEKDKEKDLKQFTYYIGTDLAVSIQERRDYSAFVVGAMDQDGMLHIVNVIKERMDSLKIIETLIRLHIKYHPELISLEKGQIEKSIGPFLRAEMFRTGQFLNLHPLSATTDKTARSRSIAARMRAGGVKFDKSKEWFNGLQEEMLKFPKAVHDDQVDAMSYIGLILDRVVEGPTVSQLLKDMREEEMAEQQESDIEIGRNPLTGY